MKKIRAPLRAAANGDESQLYVAAEILLVGVVIFGITWLALGLS